MFEPCYRLESTIFSFLPNNCKSQVIVPVKGPIFSPTLGACVLTIGVQIWGWSELFELHK